MRIKDFINGGGLAMNKAAGCFHGLTADKLNTKLNLFGGYMKSCVDVNMYLSRYIDSNNIALFAQVLVAPPQTTASGPHWVEQTHPQAATGGRYI